MAERDLKGHIDYLSKLATMSNGELDELFAQETIEAQEFINSVKAGLPDEGKISVQRFDRLADLITSAAPNHDGAIGAIRELGKHYSAGVRECLRPFHELAEQVPLQVRVARFNELLAR